MSAIVAIPARLKSTRFPRKVLANINGRPMLWHVYQGVSQANRISGVWVITDSEEVFEEASSWGAKSLMTSEQCPSGTARIAEAIDALDADIIVNVQADEPLITGSVVNSIVGALESTDFDVATPVFPIDNMEDLQDPNLVKVVRRRDGSALYFSRSPIPHVRDLEPGDWIAEAQHWGHAGVYGYRRKVLLDYPRMPESPLERAEKLEQLRLLEAGIQILTVEMDYRPQGVDVPADLEAVKRILEPANHGV